MLATIKKFISSLLVKLKTKRYNYFLIGLFSAISLFVIVFNTQSAERKSATGSYHNLPGSLNNLKDFFETIENESFGLNDFLAIDKNLEVLQLGKQLPCHDPNRYNSQISLQSNGAICGTLQLKLNGIYDGAGGLLKNISRIDLYHSYQPKQAYRVVETHISPDPSSNRDSILNFNVTHPGYYRALITFVGLDCAPPRSVNDNIQTNPGQYLTREPGDPLQGNAQILDPVIKTDKGQDVPSEICDMSGLVLQTKIAIRTRLMVEYVWYIDGINVETNYNGRLTLSNHITETPGNVHKIKVTAQRETDKQDNNCKAILPYDEIDVKITQLPEAKLYAGDTQIDQKPPGQNIYYFKPGEKIELKAKDSDGRDFDKYEWYANNALQKNSTSIYTFGSTPKDNDTIKVVANHTVGANQCSGIATVIFKPAYIYAPDFTINNSGVRSDNIFSFCKEIPKNTSLTLTDSQPLEKGKTAIDLMLEEDPNTSIQWIRNMDHMDTTNLTSRLSDRSKRQTPAITQNDSKNLYRIIITTKAKKIYIDTNAKAIKGVKVKAVNVAKPKIQDYNEGDTIHICQDSTKSIPVNTLKLDNLQGNGSALWEITNPDSTTTKITADSLRLPNQALGEYTIQVKFSKTEDGITCQSEATTIKMRIYPHIFTGLAYKNSTGNFSRISPVEKYIAIKTDVYAKNIVLVDNKYNITDIDQNAKITWYESIGSENKFTPISGATNRTITIDPGKFTPGEVRYYKYKVSIDAQNPDVCTNSSLTLIAYNPNPVVQVVGQDTLSCDINKPVELKIKYTEPTNGYTTLFNTAPTLWYYKELSTSGLSGGTTVTAGQSFKAAKTGYYAAYGKFDLKKPGSDTRISTLQEVPASDFYVRIENIDPVVAYKNTQDAIKQIQSNSVYLATIMDLYARNTSDLNEFSEGKITWLVSETPSGNFTQVGDNKQKLTIDRTTFKDNSVKYYKYSYQLGPDSNGHNQCTKYSPVIPIYNIKPAIEATSGRSASCDNKPIELKIVARNAQNKDILNSTAITYWEYSASENGPWSIVATKSASPTNIYRATKTGYYRARGFPVKETSFSSLSPLDSLSDFSQPFYVHVENLVPVIAYTNTANRLAVIDPKANYIADIKDLYARHSTGNGTLNEFGAKAKITWYVSENTPNNFSQVPGFDNNQHLTIDTSKLTPNAIYYYKYTYTYIPDSDTNSQNQCFKDSPIILVANIQPTIKVEKGGDLISCDKDKAVTLKVEALDAAGKSFINPRTNSFWYYRAPNSTQWQQVASVAAITYDAGKTGHYRVRVYPTRHNFKPTTILTALDDLSHFSDSVYVQIENVKPVVAYTNPKSTIAEISTGNYYMAVIKDLYAKNKNGAKLEDFVAKARIKWYQSGNPTAGFNEIKGANQSTLTIDTNSFPKNTVRYYKYQVENAGSDSNSCSGYSPALAVINLRPSVVADSGAVSCDGKAVRLRMEALDPSRNDIISSTRSSYWEYKASAEAPWQKLPSPKNPTNLYDATKTGFYRARGYSHKEGATFSPLKNLGALDAITYFSDSIYVHIDKIDPVIAYTNTVNKQVTEVNTSKYYSIDPKVPLYARNTSKVNEFPANTKITWFVSDSPTGEFKPITGANQPILNIDTSSFQPNTIKYYKYTVELSLDGQQKCSKESPAIMVVNFSYYITSNGNRIASSKNELLTSCNGNRISLGVVALDPQNRNIIDTNAVYWTYKPAQQSDWIAPITRLTYDAASTGYYKASVKAIVNKNIVGQKEPLSKQEKHTTLYLSIQSYNPFIGYRDSKGAIAEIKTDSNYMADLKELYARYRNGSGVSEFSKNIKIAWYVSDNPTTGFTLISGANQATLKIDTNGFKKNTVRYYKYAIDTDSTSGYNCHIESPVLTVVNFQISVKTDNNLPAISCDNEAVNLRMEALTEKGEDIINRKSDGFWYYRKTQNASWERALKARGLVSYKATKTGYYRASAYPTYPDIKTKKPLQDETDYSESIFVTISPPISKPIIRADHTKGVCKGSPVELSAFSTLNASKPYSSDFTYQWYLEQKPIKGATNSKYKTDVVGLYTVEVINKSTQCKNISDEYIVKDVTLNPGFKINHLGATDTTQFLITRGAGGTITVSLEAPQADTNRYKWKVTYVGSEKQLPIKYTSSPQAISISAIQNTFGSISGHYILSLTDSLYNCTKEQSHDFYLVYREEIKYTVNKGENELVPTNNVYKVCKGDTVNIKTKLYELYNNDTVNTKFRIKYVLYKDNKVVSTTISEKEPLITASGSGIYRLEAKVLKPIEGNDSLGSNLKPVTFTIKEEDRSDLTSDFVVANNLCINVGYKVKLTANQTNNNNNSYKWYKEENGTRSEIGNKSEIEVALEPGNHSIELVVTDANHCFDRLTQTIYVTEKPGIEIHASQSIICESQNSVLQVIKKSNDTISKYQWQTKQGTTWTDIPNATSSELQVTEAGEYRSKVVNTDNCENTSNSIEVKQQTLTADFTPNKDAYCFDATGNHNITLQASQADAQYSWTITTPTKTITNNTKSIDIDIKASGIYTIKLIVSKNGCSEQSEKRIVALIKPDIQYNRSKDMLCVEKSDSIEVNLQTNYDTNLPLHYKWYKGTTLLQTDSVANKIKITEEGTYHVELELINPIDNKLPVCTVIGRDIIITRSTINAGIEISGNECIDPANNKPIKFTAKDTVGTNYEWTIKDSNQRSIKHVKNAKNEAELSTVSLNPGQYTVTLNVRDSLCTATSTKTFSITRKPKASLSSNDELNVICNDSKIKLTVTLDQGTNATGVFTYVWYHQVNNTWQKIENNANTNVYETNQAGVYKAEVTSADGCKTETNVINAIKSTVNPKFTMDPENTLCINNDQKFVLTAEDDAEGNVYEWRNILNGQKFYGPKLTIGHEAIVFNHLMIRLTVTNKYGCTGSYDVTNKTITYSSHPHISVKDDIKEICIVEDSKGTEVSRTSVTLTAMTTDVQEVNYKSYKWQKQRLPMWMWDDIQGATGKDYQVKEAGNYKVLAMNNDNCEGESEVVTITESRVASGFTNSIHSIEDSTDYEYILLCINKGDSITFTAKDKEAKKYNWHYKNSPDKKAQNQTFPTGKTGDISTDVITTVNPSQGYLEVSLSLEKNKCVSDTTTHKYYVLYHPRISIEDYDKNILCNKDDSVSLYVSILDPQLDTHNTNTTDNIHVLYQWYKKVDGKNIPVSKETEIDVKEPGEYFVEVTYKLQGKGAAQTCVGTSTPITIRRIEINADHNYTETSEIHCLDTDSINFEANYKSATASYNWVITDLATNVKETSTAASFSYKVKDEGRYKISLQVKDEQVCTKTSEHELSISIKPPVVTINKDPNRSNFCSYEVMTLHASPSKDFKNLQYEWQYSKDNNKTDKWSTLAKSARTSHSVTKTGYYRVILHSQSDCQSESEPVYVDKSEINIKPSIHVEKCPDITQELVIHNTTNYNGIEPQTCTWDFGDGTAALSSCDTLVHHKYSALGTYKLTLTVIAKDGCRFSNTFSIDYKGETRPNAKIDIENKKNSYCQLDSIIIKDVSEYKMSSQYSAKWKVEANGEDITDEVIKANNTETITIQPLRSISTDVEYKVTLTSTNTVDGDNCQDDTTTTLQITAQPELDFDDIPTDICKDHDPIVFKGHYKYSGKNNVKEIYEYEKVGSGTRTRIDGNQLPVKDLAVGAYNIYYRVEVSNNGSTNASMCKEERKHTITIHDYQLPVIKIQGNDKDAVCEGNSITLTVTKDFDNYQWYKDGELIPHATNKIFQAEQTGSYHVVTNYKYCGTKQSNALSVTVFGVPTAKFTFPDQLECKDEKIRFINNSTSQSPIVKYEWDFGDGGKSEEENPEHAYQEVGDYDITLKVTNQDGCSAFIKQNFSYRKIKPKIEFMPITACIVDPVEAQAQVHLVTGNVGTMEWTLYADGSAIEHQTYNNSDQKFKYLIPKQYANSKLELELKLTTDEGCVVTERLPIVLKPLPDVSIGFKQMRVCSQAHYINLREKATPAVGGTWYIIKPGLTEREKETIDNGLLDVSQLLPGVYKILLEYKNNSTSCSNVDEAEIIIEAEPHGEIVAITKDNREIKGDTRSNTVDLCDSDGLRLRVNVDKATLRQAYTYTWYKDSVPISNAMSDIIDIHEPGTYEVHISMGNRSGCATETKLKINISSSYRVAIDPKPIELCKSSKPIKLEFGSITPASSENVGTEAYYVLRGGKKSEQIVMFDPSKYSGDVEVLYEFVSFNGCKDSKSKIIKVITLDGSVQETIEVKEGDSAVIRNDVHSDNGATLTYKWMPNTYLSSDDIAEPTVTPQRDIVYNLSISNGSDCVYNYKVKVVVIPNLHVPNVILPNSGSASNSVLHISGIEKYPNAIITIVNRFGQKVWESEPGYPTPWDGMDQNGQPLEIGTYYYILKMNKQSSEFQQDATDATAEKYVEDLTGYIEIIY
ncbi:MAG: PKD domain-containing protein [Solitalea-like symbiont of Acarus siro]